MLKVNYIQSILDKEISKIETDYASFEKKTKQLMYSQNRTSESILMETSNLISVKKRLLSLYKLKQSLSTIKKEDEPKDSIQKLLNEINVILQNI